MENNNFTVTLEGNTLNIVLNGELKTDNAPRENMSLGDERIESYLCGQTVGTDNSSRGYRLMAVDGYTMGWGKCDGRIIKNHYPKGLRIMK